MHPIGKRILGLLFLLPIAALVVVPVIADNSETADHMIKVVRLKHLETQEAVTVLRSIFQTRQIAELRARGIIVFRDAPEAVEQATELLREIDVPSPSRRESTEAVEAGGPDAAMVENGD